MLWTTNSGAFYWWHFECTEIPWWDPEAHCCAIHPWPSSHVAAWKMHGPMLQGSVHNSWKPKTSQFLHGQHTHQACHPSVDVWIIQLRIGWMLWYRLGWGFICMPFHDRSAHMSSRESTPEWGPSIAITPFWLGQVWFSDLISLLDGSPWEIPVRRVLLSQAEGMIFHPCSELWKLWVWPLRGHNS